MCGMHCQTSYLIRVLHGYRSWVRHTLLEVVAGCNARCVALTALLNELMDSIQQKKNVKKKSEKSEKSQVQNYLLRLFI